MRRQLAECLHCATCNNDRLSVHSITATPEGAVAEGFIYCENKHWFPIEGGVLEFLPPELAYTADREKFWSAHESILAGYGLEAKDTTRSGIAETTKKEVLHQQEHFDWYAENDAQSYDEYSTMKFWSAVDNWTFKRWSKLIKPGDLVLDVGCAQGRASIQLAEKSPSVIGIDISKKLIRKAYDNFKQANFKGQCDFLVADGSNPPFKDGTFDCVLIYGVLHHLPNPGATCRKVARILKANGLFLSSENNQSAFRAIFDLLMKIKAIWHEEAGAQPLLSDRDIAKWFDATGVKTKTSTIVFLPPHLVNLLPQAVGRASLRLTDMVCSKIPFLKRNGGLLIIEGQKESTASV